MEPFLVGVATLSLLTAAAEENLVLCVVDDAHWLDPATAGRCCSAPAGSVRTGWPWCSPPATTRRRRSTRRAVAELVLTGLDPDASRALLERAPRRTRRPRRSPERLDRRDAAATRWPCWSSRRAHRRPAQGYVPPAGPAPPHRAGRAGLPRPEPPPARRVQTLLLLAAADDTGDVAVLRRAASRPRPGRDALEAALDSGLLVEDASVVACVTRWCVRRSTRPRRARTAAGPPGPGRGPGRHRRPRPGGLAPCLRCRRPGRRGGRCPRARRVAGPATRRARRGAGGVRARSEPVRPTPPSVPRLMFAAARSAWACGQAGPAQTLLVGGARGADRPAAALRHRAPARSHRGQPRVGHRGAPDLRRGRPGRPPDRPGPGPRHRRRRGRHAHLRRRQRHAAARRPTTSASRVAGDPPRTLCLKQHAGRHDPGGRGRLVRRRARPWTWRCGREQVDDRDVLWNLGNAALQLGDDDAAAALLRLRPVAGPGGRRRHGGRLLPAAALLRPLPGRRPRRGAQQRRGGRSPSRTSIGQPAMTALPIAWLALLAALQDRDDYDDLLLRLEELVTTYPLGILTDPVHDLTRWAKGPRAAGDGDSVGALHHLSRFRLPVLARMAAAERIEAAVRAGETRPGPGLDRRAGVVRRGHRPALGARHGRLRPGADGRPGRGRGALPGGAVPPRARRSPPRRGARPAGLRRVAAPQPAPRRRPPAPAPGPRDLPGPARRGPGRARQPGAACLRRDRPQARPLHAGRAHPDGAEDRPAGELRDVEQGRRGPVLDLARTVAFHLRNIFAKAGITSRGELAQLDLA